MPEVKSYVVEQTRRVRVTANNAVDAGDIASVAFDDGPRQTEGWGHTNGEIQILGLNIKAG